MFNRMPIPHLTTLAPALALAFSCATVVPVPAQTFPLYVADYQGSGLYRMDAAGQVELVFPSDARLASVRADADGNVYTCRDDSPDVVKIDAAGNASVFVTGLGGCFGLVFGADGTLYISDVVAGRIAAVPPGTTTLTTLASGLVFPAHMALAGDGSVVVAEFGAGRVVRLHPGGALTTLAGDLASPLGVAVGADDSIYVSEAGTGQIVRVDGTGAVSVVTSRGDAGPSGLDFDQDGRLFVAELSAGQIAIVDVTTGAVEVFRTGLASPVALAFEPGPRQVRIDLKPGNAKNPIHREGHGIVRVAVFGSAEFDVSAIDLASVGFGVTGQNAAPVESRFRDVDGDGRADLVLRFRTESLGIGPKTPSPVTLKLTGRTRQGAAFQGEDVAQLVP